MTRAQKIFNTGYFFMDRMIAAQCDHFRVLYSITNMKNDRASCLPIDFEDKTTLGLDGVE